jgi:uncharacterized protein
MFGVQAVFQYYEDAIAKYSCNKPAVTSTTIIPWSWSAIDNANSRLMSAMNFLPNVVANVNQTQIAIFQNGMQSLFSVLMQASNDVLVNG